ncbi:MAG TPA: DNA polymerase Y family protein [Actinomycetota bacterium]
MPRMVVVWCPDWPVAAAGAPPDSLTAVVHANRVVACSKAARAEGVRPGLRRRAAQGRCPELELLAHDPARDARAFEPVLAAVEQLTPWVEVLQPGECAFPARGAARYHGGEPALAVTVTAAVHAAVEGRGGPGDHRGGPPVAWAGCRVGVADGTFAAGLAARRQAIVPPGGSRAFLAPHPVAALDRPDLADLLVRLGLRTLGDLAALPGIDLATRFGPEGARAARLATGLDEHPRGARRPPPDLRVSAELDPPADRVDIAAFTAKTLADELVARLDHLGLACTRLRIEAETDQPETLSRVWRYDPTTPPTPHLPSSPGPVPRSPTPASGGSCSRGPGDPPARMAAVMAERVRWQLDGWLTGRTGNPPGALTHLTLIPDEVVPNQGRQLGFWGGESALTQRAARALARIQGLLGPEAVQTAHLQGGRDPATRVTLTPATESGGAAVPVGPQVTPGPGSQGPGRGAGPEIGRARGARAEAGELPARSDPVPTARSHLAPSPPIASPADPPAVRAPDLADPPASPPGPPASLVPGPTGGLSARGPTGFSTRGAGRLPGAVPWPGQVPAPAPAIVYAEPVPAEVVDATGATVAVDGRGLLGPLPSRVRVRGRGWSSITAWAGPWLVDERWWDPAAHRRLVRLQATTDQGAAYLLRLTGGRWWVEAIYD